MKKLLLLLFLFLINYSVFGEEKLTLYRCTTPNESYMCNKGCVIDTTGFIEKSDRFLGEFKVNVKKNLVLKTTFRASDLELPIVGPYYLDNCKVLDESNWKCKNSYGTITQIVVSYNGIISSNLSVPGAKKYTCYK